jgi:hypothetical protein
MFFFESFAEMLNLVGLFTSKGSVNNGPSTITSDGSAPDSCFIRNGDPFIGFSPN